MLEGSAVVSKQTAQRGGSRRKLMSKRRFPPAEVERMNTLWRFIKTNGEVAPRRAELRRLCCGGLSHADQILGGGGGPARRRGYRFCVCEHDSRSHSLTGHVRPAPLPAAANLLVRN